MDDIKLWVLLELEGVGYRIPEASIHTNEKGEPYLYSARYDDVLKVIYDNGYYIDHFVNQGLDVLKKESKPTSEPVKVFELYAMTYDCEEIMFKGKLELEN